jgi:hypothetical protein
MAGSGPDFLFLERNSFQNVFDFARSGFFADFYTLIERCTRTNLEDYYTHVLQEFEMLGMLPIFPLGFSFQYIGISEYLPSSVVNEFANLPFLTRMQLVNIYLEFRENYPDYDNFSAGLPWNMTSFWGLFNNNAPNFINLATRTSYLNTPEFISMLIELEEMFSDDPFQGGFGSSVSLPISHVTWLRESANEVMFITHDMGLNPTHAFITTDESPFIHYRPLTDEAGRLIIDLEGGWHHPNWATVAITNGSNADLAWEFVHYLIDAFANPVGRATVMPGWGASAPWGMGALTTPIRRDLAQTHVRRTFEHVLGNHAWAFGGFTEQDERYFPSLAEEAAVRFLAYSERPVSLTTTLFPMQMLSSEHLSEFMTGMISADVAAQRMHNRISLWLIE